VITEMRVKNFKGWESRDWFQLAPLTVFFGTNSSGKTSLLQLLLLLKQTAESADRRIALHFGDKSTPVELGTFMDAVFDHDGKRELEVGVRWSLAEQLFITDPQASLPAIVSFAPEQLGFETGVGLIAGEPEARWIRYDLGDVRFGLEREEETEDFAVTVDPPKRWHFERRPGRPGTVSGPVRFYGFPPVLTGNFTNAWFLADLELELEGLLQGIRYLGPLREDPRREYTWAGTQPEDVGRRGERAIEALLAAQARKLRVRTGHKPKSPTIGVETWVARWLKKLGLIEEFEVEPIVRGGSLYRVRVRRTAESSSVLLTDVGFGVSQVLPVLVLLGYAPEGSVVILEQPEIHLHAAVQAGLADAILDAIDKRRLQVIVESHSEHFLQRLQRRVAEEGSADQLALYFTAVEEGQSTLTSLDLDVFGDIANWPSDFFGDPLGDALAMTRAAANRRSSE